MKFIVEENVTKVWLEKQFDSPPDGFSLSVVPLPEVKKKEILCGLWEEREAILEENCRVQVWDMQEETCKHFVLTMTMIVYGPSITSKPNVRRFGYYPRVIIAKNEGGHCSTGICLDCLLEKVG